MIEFFASKVSKKDKSNAERSNNKPRSSNDSSNKNFIL